MAAAPQFGDIVAAVRICRWIHSKCIAPENAASQMYLDFRKDIIAFGIGLEQLQKVFPTAAAYTESLDDSLDFPDHYAGFQQRPRSLELEAMELIGNFKATLEECKKLLRRYVRFENGRSTFWDNAFWHSGTQETVESLRSRIEAHTAGIKLIIEPLQLRLITNIDENVSVILQLLRLYLGLDRPTKIPAILATLTPKFKAAILRDAPQGVDVTNLRQLPVRETVQILRIHFENSTKKSALGVHLEMEQYLNLLKAQWLVSVLNQSETLRMPQSQLHRRIVGQIEQWIAKEYTREDFLSWDQLALEGMDDAAFAIWPKPKPPRIPQPTDAMAGEEHIGTIQTIPPEWAEKQTLDVFRSPDNILRFVCSQIPIGNPNAPIRTIFSLNTRHDTFIPRYTMLDSAAKRSWCIQTTSRYGNDQHIFDINSMQDAHKLQRAFTRYSVFTSRSNVKCAVTCCEEGWLAKIKGVDPILGRGEVQLWQWPTIQKPAQENLKAGQSSRRQSSASADRRSYSHRSVKSIASSFKELPSSVVSVTEEGGKGVVVASTSPPPFLLAFLQQENLEKMASSSRSSVQYIMWKIDVSNLKSVTRNNPLEITLRCKDGDNFGVQSLSTSEDKLDMWNLCALVDPLHHARKIPDIPRPKSMKCAYIVLVFTTAEESELFVLNFDLVTRQCMLENMYAAQGQRIAYANEVSKLEDRDEKIGVRSRQSSTTSATSLSHTTTRPTERPWVLPPQNFNFQPISLTPPRTPDPEDSETLPDPA